MRVYVGFRRLPLIQRVCLWRAQMSQSSIESYATRASLSFLGASITCTISTRQCSGRIRISAMRVSCARKTVLAVTIRRSGATPPERRCGRESPPGDRFRPVAVGVTGCLGEWLRRSYKHRLRNTACYAPNRVGCGERQRVSQKATADHFSCHPAHPRTHPSADTSIRDSGPRTRSPPSPRPARTSAL